MSVQASSTTGLSAFSVYPYLPDTLRSFTLRAVGSPGDYTVEENTDLLAVVAEALDLNKIQGATHPHRPGGRATRAVGRRNNFLAVTAGVVWGYERNTTANRFLADEGIEIVPVVGSELGRSRGGSRCMSCPIERDAVTL